MLLRVTTRTHAAPRCHPLDLSEANNICSASYYLALLARAGHVSESITRKYLVLYFVVYGSDIALRGTRAVLLGVIGVSPCIQSAQKPTKVI